MWLFAYTLFAASVFTAASIASGQFSSPVRAIFPYGQKKCGDKGSKMSEQDAVSDFCGMDSRISFIRISAVCMGEKMR